MTARFLPLDTRAKLRPSEQGGEGSDGRQRLLMSRPDPADPRQLAGIPDWAKPVLEAAIRLQEPR